MKPLGMSRADLARRLAVPPNRITQIIKGQRAITPDTAIRLEVLFGWPAAYWMQNQLEHDLEVTRQTEEKQIRVEVQPIQRPA